MVTQYNNLLNLLQVQSSSQISRKASQAGFPTGLNQLGYIKTSETLDYLFNVQKIVNNFKNTINIKLLLINKR